MSERERYELFESVFAALSADERAAILGRAEARVKVTGRGPDSFGYGTRVRLERDRLLLAERPNLFPGDLRKSAPVSRERHEPLAEERDS